MGADASRRGRTGEGIAARHLEAAGWTILDRNWRDGPRELDLVVRRAGVVAVVEVKTRRVPSWAHPLDALTPRKRHEIQRATGAWLAEARERGEHPRVVRFDVVVVLLHGAGRATVEHVPDAWRSGWNG